MEDIRRDIQAARDMADDLTELAGQGSDEDRAEMKRKIRAAQAERATDQAELTRFRRYQERSSKTITPEAVTEILAGFTKLLSDAASFLHMRLANPRAVIFPAGISLER